jgi:hypothetical protein
MKIVYLPLDERPCNYSFIKKLVLNSNIELVTIDINLLGEKKQAANYNSIKEFLLKETIDARGLVISIDMLLYGGIVPSRLHNLKEEDINERFELLNEIKRNNKNIIIFGFNLIMRCPNYSISDEEPDYYDLCGLEIHKIGELIDKHERGIVNESDYLSEYNILLSKITQTNFLDYTLRRKINKYANLKFVEYVNNSIIDFGIIPQDDSSVYGFTSIDQKEVKSLINQLDLSDKLLVYPGADEVGMIMTTKMISIILNKSLKIYVSYAKEESKDLIPSYEDSPLDFTISKQIEASNSNRVFNIDECDCILMINAPIKKMVESTKQNSINLDYLSRDLDTFVSNIRKYVDKDIPVGVGDVAYANGGDLELLRLLKKADLLFDIASYAGWNTSSNTLGTTISQLVLSIVLNNKKENLDFLGLRYVEDMLYCSRVRSEVNEMLKPPYNHFLIDGKKGVIVSQIKEKLNQYILTLLDNNKYNIIINDIYSPWNRMFEVGLEVKVIEKHINNK